MADYDDFRRWAHEVRIANGLTQAEIAEKFGVPKGTWQSWEATSGGRNIGRTHYGRVVEIAQRLGYKAPPVLDMDELKKRGPSTGGGAPSKVRVHSRAPVARIVENVRALTRAREPLLDVYFDDVTVRSGEPPYFLTYQCDYLSPHLALTVVDLPDDNTAVSVLRTSFRDRLWDLMRIAEIKQQSNAVLGVICRQCEGSAQALCGVLAQDAERHGVQVKCWRTGVEAVEFVRRTESLPEPAAHG